MGNQIQNLNFKREYDLLERTGKFSEKEVNIWNLNFDIDLAF